MKTPVQIKRSDNFKEMYPDIKLIEAFGTLDPSIGERTDHRNNLWDEWLENSVQIVESITKKDLHYKVIKTLQASGYRDPFDYQCRPNYLGAEIRFKDKNDVYSFKITLAEARLSW